MKKFLFVLVVSLFAFGCGSSVEAPKNADGVTPSDERNTARPGNPTASSETVDDAVQRSEALQELKASEGQLVTDLKFWDNREIVTRLEKMMGADHTDMKKHWNTQTPIRVDGDVVMTTGCEQHNCGPNQYILFADAAKNVLQVVHIKDGKVKEYKEAGDITLPKAFADDLARMKSNK
ncbi:MAG: hypothetical protein KF855_01365 [Acidobacteria bacterium]|nr:hypothetical protein [Acidobacteriota bacterium]